MLRFVVSISSSVSSLDYESCELSKHHRATYPSRVNNRSCSAFELVRSDVWGSSHVSFVKNLDIFSFLSHDLVILTKREIRNVHCYRAIL